MEIIDALRKWKFNLTLYEGTDTTTNRVVFMLGVRLIDQVDIWYVSRCVMEAGILLIPAFDEKHGILYFPTVLIGKKEYEALIND